MKLIIQGITQSNGGTAKNVNIPTTPVNYTLPTANCQIMDFTAEVFQDINVGTNDRFDDSGTYHGWNVYMAHDAPEQFYHVNVFTGNTTPEENWQSDSITPLSGGENLMTNLVNLVNLAIAQAPVGGYDEIIFVSNIPERTIGQSLQDDFIRFWFKALQYFETQTSITVDKIFIVNSGKRQVTYVDIDSQINNAKKLMNYINYMPTIDSRITTIKPLDITIASGITVDKNALEFNDVGVNVHYIWQWQKALSDYLISQIFI